MIGHIVYRTLQLAVAGIVLVAASGSVIAQEKFPSRPIEMVVNFGPGGGADLMGRLIAKLLEPRLGVSVPVANVAGSAGNAGLTKVKTSKADGYTIGTMTGLSVSNWALGIGQLSLKDFTFIGITQLSPSMLFVPADSPHKTYKDLLAYAKANPKKIRIATAGYGTLDDVAVRYHVAKGYDVVNVPYAKPAERYTSILGKHAEVLYEEPGDVVQFLNAKKMRAVVVFDTERHADFKDVPTGKEHGHDLVQPNWRGIVGPPNMPPAVVKVLIDALIKATASAEWKGFCAKTWSCTKPWTPEESRKIAQTTFDDIAEFAKQHGLKKN
jgi:tripartite-type tricarboxylate transporter receptor subunit TctC